MFDRFKKNLVFEINDKKLLFNVRSNIARKWFFPRYAKGKPHEAAVLNYLSDKYKDNCNNFFDIGANVGFYSIFSARSLGCNSVHAFEVDPELVNEIIANKRLNKINNMKITTAAVWKDSGSLFCFKENQEGNKSTNSVTSSNVNEQIYSVSISIDDYCKKHNIQPDIIKIDVEGAELEVLEGMRETLKKIKCMLLEIHPQMLVVNGNCIKDILYVFEHYEFTIYQIENHHKKISRLIKLKPEEITRLKNNTMLVLEQRC